MTTTKTATLPTPDQLDAQAAEQSAAAEQAAASARQLRDAIADARQGAEVKFWKDTAASGAQAEARAGIQAAWDQLRDMVTGHADTGTLLAAWVTFLQARADGLAVYRHVQAQCALYGVPASAAPCSPWDKADYGDPVWCLQQAARDVSSQPGSGYARLTEAAADAADKAEAAVMAGKPASPGALPVARFVREDGTGGVFSIGRQDFRQDTRGHYVAWADSAAELLRGSSTLAEVDAAGNVISTAFDRGVPGARDRASGTRGTSPDTAADTVRHYQ